MYDQNNLLRIFIYLILMTAFGCKNEENISGVFYDKSMMMNIGIADVHIKNDSLFIINKSTQDTAHFNEKIIYANIDDNNNVIGKCNDGRIFSGKLIRTEESVKVINDKKDFIFEAFSDTNQIQTSYTSFINKRSDELKALSPTQKGEYISSIIKTNQPKIILATGVSNGFSEIPMGTKFIVVTDFSTFQNINLYISELDSFIKNKIPLVLRVSNREVVFSGNRFKEWGLSRADVGYTYDYGNYKYKKNRKEVEIFYFDFTLNSIKNTGFGYIKYEDDNELSAFNFHAQKMIEGYFVKSSWPTFFYLIETSILKNAISPIPPVQRDEQEIQINQENTEEQNSSEVITN